jgi:hypothetical protein
VVDSPAVPAPDETGLIHPRLSSSRPQPQPCRVAGSGTVVFSLVDHIIRQKHRRAAAVDSYSGYLVLSTDDLFPAIARHRAQAAAAPHAGDVKAPPPPAVPAPSFATPLAARGPAPPSQLSIPSPSPSPGPNSAPVAQVPRPGARGVWVTVSPSPVAAPGQSPPQPQPPASASGLLSPPNAAAWTGPAGATTAAQTQRPVVSPPGRPAGGPIIPGGKSGPEREPASGRGATQGRSHHATVTKGGLSASPSGTRSLPSKASVSSTGSASSSRPKGTPGASAAAEKPKAKAKDPLPLPTWALPIRPPSRPGDSKPAADHKAGWRAVAPPPTPTLKSKHPVAIPPPGTTGSPPVGASRVPRRSRSRSGSRERKRARRDDGGKGREPSSRRSSTSSSKSRRSGEAGGRDCPRREGRPSDDHHDERESDRLKENKQKSCYTAKVSGSQHFPSCETPLRPGRTHQVPHCAAVADLPAGLFQAPRRRSRLCPGPVHVPGEVPRGRVAVQVVSPRGARGTAPATQGEAARLGVWEGSPIVREGLGLGVVEWRGAL